MPEEQLGGRSHMIRRRASSALAEVLWDIHLLPSIGLPGVAHYLPAGRSGLLEAWTDVVRLRLAQDRDDLVLTGREPAALGGIALDFLLRTSRTHPPGTEAISTLSRKTRCPTAHRRTAVSCHPPREVDRWQSRTCARPRASTLAYLHARQQQYPSAASFLYGSRASPTA